MRRDPGESLHRTVADHIRTQTGYLSGNRNVCLVIVATEGGGVRRSVVKNEHLDHRPGILPIRRALTQKHWVFALLNAIPAYRKIFGEVFPEVAAGAPINFFMFGKAIAEF